MRLWFLYVIVGALIFAGGCTMKKEVEPMEWPKTPAFQDEDTRQMLDSTKEVQEGYYLYTSKTGGYTMLWPVDAKLDSYDNKGDTYEKIILSANSMVDNYFYEIRTTFDNSAPESYIDNFLSNLSESLQYTGEYKEIKVNNFSIYFAKKKSLIETSDGRQYTIYHYFSYIRDNQTNQGFEYTYAINCSDDERIKECKINESEQEERALMLMKSISLKKVYIEDE
ncbi:hypothetical protein [Metabacillus malikii]|uniref:Lipoprotein YvcA n=1 Tax=Metabacillus malikii TaxID=1504265 RepID=A0ABT9ZJ03_9BACI|nr:hypothetical protein [Metabacillus malikii]MDQ0231215.1 hypothetical protein [Metabacillus malikii]